MGGFLFMSSFIIISVLILLIVFMLLIGVPLNILKVCGRIAGRIFISVMLLFILNLVFSSFGYHLPINYFTIAFTGVLGIPGLAALSVISIYMV
jgi:inhibitor of the pro-sigma K processing machinery